MDYGLLWFFWVGFFLFIWTLVRIIQCFTGKLKLRYIAHILLIWGVGFAITYGIHHVRSTERQKQATIVAIKILQFQQSHKRYPTTLEELDLDSNQLKKQISLHYSAKNPPKLFYLDTKMPYSVFEYDFATQQWRLRYS